MMVTTDPLDASADMHMHLLTFHHCCPPAVGAMSRQEREERIGGLLACYLQHVRAVYEPQACQADV